MEKSGCKNKCISFGNFNSLYGKLILGSTGLYIGIILLLVVIKDTNNYFKGNIKGINIITYLFFNNLCESLMIIPHLLLKKKIVSEKYESPKKENLNAIEKYIFNQTSIQFSKKELIYFALFSILKLCLDIAYIIHTLTFSLTKNMTINNIFIKMFSYSFQFELLFLFLLSKIIYKIKFYKHQYFSIIALTVISVIKLIFIHIGEVDSEEDEVGRGMNFFIHFAFDIGYSFFKSLMTVYIKGLMEYKYFSPYKICFIFGIFNFLIATILLIILSFVPCKPKTNICNFTYGDDEYYAHILEIFNEFGLFIFIFILIKAILTILNYVTIHKFSVCHTILIIHLSQIMELLTLSDKAKDDKNSKAITIAYIVFVVVVVLVIGTIIVLIFLEIIEVHLFNMDTNIKKNIVKRAMLDIELSDTNDDNNCDAAEEVEQTISKEESEET